MGRFSTRQKVLLGALLLAHGALAWQLRARGIFTFGDDAGYVLLSRSLRAFSYREIQFVGDPVAARFPPGYPAFLAVITGVGGERLWLVSLAGILVSILTLLALFDVVRKRWSVDLALLATAVTAANPIVATNAGSVASETLYTGLTVGALWAASQSELARERSERGSGAAFAAGALAIAAALTRSAGVTLLPALGVHWLLRRRFRWFAALGFAATITVGGWLAWTVVAPGREMRRSYVDDAVNVRTPDGSLRSTIAIRLARNVSTYVGQTALSELAVPVSQRTRIDNVAWVAALGLLLVLGLATAWRRWNVAVWYFAAYCALLAVWAYVLDRFLDPLIPVLVALLIVGAGVLAERFAARLFAAGPALVAIALTAGALGMDARLVARATDCDRSRVDCSRPVALDFLDAVAYLGARSPADARVITPKAPTLYYHAKRKALYWDEVITQSPKGFAALLDRDRVSYVLATPVFSDYLTLLDLSLKNCTRLDLVKAFSPATLLLSVRADSLPPADEGRACGALARAHRIAVAKAREGREE